MENNGCLPQYGPAKRHFLFKNFLLRDLKRIRLAIRIPDSIFGQEVVFGLAIIMYEYRTDVTATPSVDSKRHLEPVYFSAATQAFYVIHIGATRGAFNYIGHGVRVEY